MEKSVKENEGRTGTVDSLKAIGYFMGFFSLSVLIAIFFTGSYRGRITNLVCGLILLVISCGSVYLSIRNGRKE